MFTIVPNWNCTGTNEYCDKLGPFVPGKFINITGKEFNGIKLLIENMKCEQRVSKDVITSAKVFAVFRAVLRTETIYIAQQRSGLSNMTLAAEGIWSSSTGQLCMVGCIGISDLEGNACDSRVCLYVPVSFSIKQRRISIGSFSSLKDPKPYFPLSFEKFAQANEIWERHQYVYSKLELADTILKKNEPLTFGAIVKKSLLRFPKLKNSTVYLSGVYALWEDLSLQTSAVPDPVLRSSTDGAAFQMEILSIGSLFGRHNWANFNGSTSEEDIIYRTRAELTETQTVLNLSAQLTLGGSGYSNFSVLFLEGLYDPRVGKMYLIGCRDVREVLGHILNKRMDPEFGLDCSIEVIISYPPSTTNWLVNGRARISISSQRKDDDPLHFAEVKLQTLPVLYRSQRNDVLSRQGVEGVLRIVMLSVAITCILSQLLYIRENSDSAPYISLVMLGVQALGYSLPLVTGAESILHRKSSTYYDNQYYDLETRMWSSVIDDVVKFLVLVSFLLTLRLCQKVWKSRVRLPTPSPLELRHIPSDKRVVLVALVIHLIGYLIVLTSHTSKSSHASDPSVFYIDTIGRSQSLWEWKTKLEEYVGLVQDFFLLPQIIGNLIWQIDRKPLRNLYFIGITVVRLLPHVYDYVMSPIPSPYVSENYEFVNSSFDFYSKLGDIFIPLTAIVLAIVVYIQQRWNYERLSQALTVGRYKLLPVARVYQKLPSMTHESELSGAVENVAFKNDRHHDED